MALWAQPERPRCTGLPLEIHICFASQRIHSSQLRFGYSSPTKKPARAEALEDRRKRLSRLLSRSNKAMREGIQLSQALTGDDAAIFRHAWGLGLEGIVSKRGGSAALFACSRKRLIKMHFEWKLNTENGDGLDLARYLRHHPTSDRHLGVAMIIDPLSYSPASPQASFLPRALAHQRESHPSL